VAQRLERRAGIGNVLSVVLACSGMAATYWAFQDPEKGRYTPDVDFTNWSATHAVTCKCARLIRMHAPISFVSFWVCVTLDTFVAPFPWGALLEGSNAASKDSMTMCNW
jgi:hypothetical protein